MKILPLIAPLLLLANGFAFAADDQSVEIRSDVKVGKRYVYEMTMDQAMKTQMADAAVDQKVGMKMKYASSIRKTAEGKKEMATKYLDASMFMDMKVNGEKMDIGLDDALAALKGKEFKAILGEGDRIEKISGFDEFMKTFADDPASKEMMSQIMSEENMKQMFNQGTLATFPKKPVTPNESWDFKMDVPLGAMGKGAMKGKYTYKGMEAKGGAPCAKIKMLGNLTIELGSAADGKAENEEMKQVLEMMKKMDMKITSSKIEGMIHFDPGIGAVRAMTTNTAFTMSMKNPADDSRISIPITQKIKMNLSAFEDLKEK